MHRSGILAASRDHLRRNRMTYLGHMRFASWHGAACIRAGLMLLVHSVVPCWYERAGSEHVRRLKASFDRHELEQDCKGSCSVA